MQRIICLLVIGLLSFNFSSASPSAIIKEFPVEQVMSKKELRKQEKAKKRKAKMDAKIEKFKAKLERKGVFIEDSVWDDEKFRLGALLVLGAIGLFILGALGLFSGLFGFLATIFALAGIALVVISLAENY
ncbi:MAG: hypothetical protein AAFO07_29140 [Bacteroidota bacterium]